MRILKRAVLAWIRGWTGTSLTAWTGAWILTGILAGTTAGCAKDPGAANVATRPIVAVTVPPQAFLVRAVAGDLVETVTMLPPGSNPHAFEPSMTELRSLERATLYFAIGHPSLPFEQSWLPRVLADRPEVIRVDAVDGLALLEEDPHVWMSPRVMRSMARTLEASLRQILPEHAATLRANLTRFEAGVDSLQAGFRDALVRSELTRFYAFHPAWGYLADELGIEQVAVEDHGHEPSPDRLARLIDRATEDRIDFVLTPPQSSRRGAEMFARSVGARLVISDPMDGDWWRTQWDLVALLGAVTPDPGGRSSDAGDAGCVPQPGVRGRLEPSGEAPCAGHARASCRPAASEERLPA